MEDQRKKYLLNRIKKEELILHSFYDKFKHLYQNKNLPDERNNSYLELLGTIIDHNNQFGQSLIEYLQKNQIKDIFQRSSAVFNDLIEKYKKLYVEEKKLEEGRDMKQIRQICQICQEKIESNHIENIKNILDRQAEARSNLIKKLIEETEKERVKPLFTYEEDEIFKKQLDKVLKQKENSLKSNQQQSNIFLQTVTKEISDFMVSFRNEFAAWEHNSIQENINWAQTMKGYLNKKLTNTFNQKIPKWIKRMHEYFVDSQPLKPKIYFANREVQTALATDQEIVLKKQVQDLKNKLESKREKLKQLFIKIELQKVRNQNLEKQLNKVSKQTAQKQYEGKTERKNDNKNLNIKSTRKIISPNNSTEQKGPLINVYSNRLKQIKQVSHGSVLPSNLIKNVQKLVKTPLRKYDSKPNLQHGQKQNIIKDQKYSSPLNSEKKQIIQIKAKQAQANISDQGIIKNEQSYTLRNNNQILKNSLRQTDLNQSNVRLKKKGYNREKREEIINDNKQEYSKIQAKYFQNEPTINNPNQISESHQKGEFNNLNEILKNSAKKNLLNHSQVNFSNNQTNINKSKKNVQNKEKVHVSIHDGKIQSLQSQLVQKSLSSQQRVIQSQLQVKMQNYLKNNKKGRNNSDLHQILDILNKYLTENLLDTNALENILSNSVITEGRSKLKNVQNLSMIKQRYKIEQKDERYSRSLHVDRNIQGKHKIVKLPKIVKNEVHKSQSQYKQFKKMLQYSCLNLFIDNETAYSFQQSLNEVVKTKKMIKPTSDQLQDIKILFSKLQVLKKNNKSTYTQIISFLKHPYTAIRCQFLTLDVINEISFPDFCNYFLKIMWVHKNCGHSYNYNFCWHITAFIKQIKLLALR